jgi:hypothetical protein
MTEDSSGANRRRWTRVPLHGEILGRIYTEAAAPILDLSEGGALVEIPCVLRPRSLYTLRLTLDASRVLALRASVVRSYVHQLEAVAEGEARVRYRAAVQFTEMSDEDRALLRGRIPGPAQQAAGQLAPVLEPGAAPVAGAPEEEPTPTATGPDEVWPEIGAHLEVAPVATPDVELVPAAKLLAAELGVTPEPPDAIEDPPHPPEETSPIAPPVESEEPVPVERPALWSRVRGWLSPAPAPQGLGTLLDLQSPPDRRDSSRLPQAGVVKGKMSLHLDSDVVSVSQGGMMVRMPYAPVTGSVVGFTVEVGGQPVPLRGTVCNAQETSDEEGNPLYLVGVEFLELGESVRREIESYLSRRLET